MSIDLNKLVSQIWAKTLNQSLMRSMADSPFEKMIDEWHKEHVKRMAEDPEYARKYEEAEQRRREECEQLEDEDYDYDYDY